MTTAPTPPDQLTLHQHLRSGRFMAGVAAGRWRLISEDWPVLVVAVSAAPRENGPTEFHLRLDCAGYPYQAPTGTLWDPDTQTRLPSDRGPKGGRADTVFRADGWNNGTVYAPWDRVALGGHPDWPQVHRMEAWNPSRDLSFLLMNVYDLLNGDSYVGV